jgi:hypothetical protein
MELEYCPLLARQSVEATPWNQQAALTLYEQSYG